MANENLSLRQRQQQQQQQQKQQQAAVTAADMAIAVFRALPPDKQIEALGLIESLRSQGEAREPRRPALEGLCADLGVSIGGDDIATARQEMWGSFPREDFL
jgi:hypothetical protein